MTEYMKVLRQLQEMSLSVIFILLLAGIVLIVAIKAIVDYNSLKKYLHTRNETLKDKFDITEDIL